jgi:hypothetical protein
MTKEKEGKKVKKVTTTVTTTTTEEIISSNERTHIICVLDRSGSMASIMSDSIGGFNAFLKKQKELPDEATITVALFDDKYEILFDYIDIKKAQEITPTQWYPRGLTALYDAIGKTINTEKAHFAKLGDEKPSKVLMVIVTDGLENNSKEYNLEGIKKLIKDCENDDWNFMYLAANQDAFAVGSGFGISAGNTFTYTASPVGVLNMSATMSDASVKYRSMSSNSADFKTMSKSLVDDKSGNISVDNDPLNSFISTGSFTTFNTTGSAVLNGDKK